MGANGRTGPVVSVWSGNHRFFRPVVSVWSGGVGLVCGMKRGISEANLSGLLVQLGGPMPTISVWRVALWVCETA